MGNTTGRAKPKPLVIKSAPGDGSGAYHVEFSEDAEIELVSLTKDGFPNAYYLPWMSGGCTECKITLSKGQIDYFFTANLSGCSIWYKFEEGRIKIRHEARTDKKVHWEHSIAGLKLVFDSSASDDSTLTVDEKTLVRTAQFFMVYAVFDYVEKVIEFRIQLVRHMRNGFTQAEKYELLRVETVSVPFPKG
jgi:hypothetical protein